ncbi:AAA family ATPase [Ornithinibacillus sp. L9]|uniref:AAA family ATPase n=1 Tax=Ornithinibacillus caprae TaxID=2678566 RepID=A0A6N8FG55_9BACI|nr:AAA family ATPase [Ornithinibacillus caprae]MUK87027.1 AAA family ATPase [Ornithinibacillus caprae]
MLKKIRIVIADTNKDYLESLGAYMRTSSNSKQFIVTYFSNFESLQKYIHQGEIIDILLISPEMNRSDIQTSKDTLVILLEDDALARSVKSHPTIYRYQRLDQLVANILGQYYENNEEAGKLLVRTNQTKIISVYSPNGGTGKTTVAVNLCKQLAINDAKVFYLNLETFNSTKLFLSDDEEENPSLQIFYYAKTNSNQLLSKIETLKKYDPYSMVNYFDIQINAEEMLELTDETINRLIKGLLETNTYDYIVLDLDSSLHERNITAIKECDILFWVVANDLTGVLKTKSLLDEEEKLFGRENLVKDKMSLILNKFNGNLIGDFSEVELTIDGYLPFIQNWIHHQSKVDLLGNDEFNQELQTIIRKIIVNDGEGVVNSG